MRVTTIMGPPGTGKTTHLAKVVDDLARTTPNMCVCSFTKAAASVLTSRLRNHSVRYIGTLHALAFKTLGMTRQSVANELHFAQWYGTDVEEVQQALAVYRYSRHWKVDTGLAFAAINPIIPYLRIEHLIQSYLNWKNAYSYMDFDDMVFHATGKVEPFEVMVIDEAQDLTNEQWNFVDSMAVSDTKLFIAGDDDQALFTWAGANPHHMADIADEIQILGQSYRIPVDVHRIAEATVGQISQRVPKEYLPTARKGTVEEVSYYEPVLYKHKHTVLCRDKWALEEIENVVIQRGIPYTRNGERSMFDRGRCNLAKAILLEDFAGIKRLSKYLRAKFRDDLVGAVKAGWQTAVDFGTWHKEATYLSLIDPISEPMIHLSTIHGFKGEEDNRVIVIADCTLQVENAMNTQETYDNEVRVWYVALTRCKESLTIVGHNQFIKFGQEGITHAI